MNGGGGIVSDDSLEGIQRTLHQWFSMSSYNKQQMAKNAFIVFKEHFQMKQVIIRLNSIFESKLNL